jgi:hypothetical protein
LPWERWVAIKLLESARACAEPWAGATYEEGGSRTEASGKRGRAPPRPWVEPRELPVSGILRFEFAEITPRSRRDHAEITPRSRRDHAEITPRSRRDQAEISRDETALCTWHLGEVDLRRRALFA